jgi:hypothetical protein
MSDIELLCEVLEKARVYYLHVTDLISNIIT